MRYSLFFLFILAILISCDNDPKLITNLETASIEGVIELENAALDTFQIQITLTNVDDASLSWQVEPDNEGSYQFLQLNPGYYQLQAMVDSRHYEAYSETVTLMQNEELTVESITLPRIENDCGIQGIVCFAECHRPDVNIEIYYLEQNDYLLDKIVHPDSTGLYQTNGLFPGDHKIIFQTEDFPQVVQYPTLLPDEMTILETVIFEEVTLINQASITIDGNLDDWGEPVYQNDHSSAWGTSNDFADFYLAYDADSLYVGISGGFSDAGNTINVYFDTDADTTGVNDFSTIQGGDIGNHLRKNFTAPDFFGADVAFSGWALQYNISVVSLENPEAVDSAELESNIVMQTDVIEFSIPLSEIYPDGILPDHRELSLIAVIGGGDDVNLADDSIPQQDNVLQFETVLTAKFAE